MQKKKLIEVALPLDAINHEAGREKSIRHGHPSTLHLWWARRPLAACRAVLFAQLVDDPSSWPDRFPTEEDQTRERQRLFDVLARFETDDKGKTVVRGLVSWDDSQDPATIEAGQREIAKSLAWNRGDEAPTEPDAVRQYLRDHAPPVLDPFAGGGSIPLEAQRLGLEAHAGDLNPVAVLINKALIEIPPQFAGQLPVNPDARKDEELFAREWRGAEGLAADVRYYGQWMRDEAEKRIGHLYPDVAVTAEMLAERPDLRTAQIKDPKTGKKRTLRAGDALTPIAWIWARTVPSPDPAADGAEVPLVRSFWLSKKKGKQTWIEPVVDRASNTYHFEIRSGAGKPQEGTVGRTGATCLLTGSPIPLSYIREQGKKGGMGTRLMAIAAESNRSRAYFAPISVHEEAAESAEPTWRPSEALPKKALGFRVQNYGMTQWSELFSERQLLALTTFSELARETADRVQGEAARADLDDPQAYASAVATYLSLIASKSADYWSSICTWRSDVKNEGIGHVFSRQAISMVWDFVEANAFSESSGSWNSSLDWLPRVLETGPEAPLPGSAKQVSASGSSLDISPVVSTDPPYYDNVPYADLSDFFYVWLRQSLADVHPELFGTLLTPKADELVADPFRRGGAAEAQKFFERGMVRTFDRLCDAADADFPVTIFYAFKQAETEDKGKGDTASTGWETFLAGLMEAGFQITATWPMRTEMSNRTRSLGSNALASSVVLACRPRPDDAPRTTRGDFVRQLARELPEALRDLQKGHIAPVDLPQAAIGPGMAVYSRYASVLEADGSAMTIRTALGLINEALDTYLSEQEGTYDTDTRWAIVWYEQFGFDAGAFGDANNLATAKNTSVEGLAAAGIVASGGGKVHLLGRDELPVDWDPAADDRLTGWESTQHLIRALETEGEDAAARLLAGLRQRSAEAAGAARDLAYRLFALCEKKKRADEALSYNGLIVAWPTLERLAEREAAEAAARAPAPQGELGL
ncbi:DUF1156 domain-containing protein [Rubrivirga sp. IMCC43871]|uniref:DUF1156 domain-containing protein n=1 Tax=Rubrivirga sp. IMCC43871 TaxID=3391575 RepID=UPI00398F9103